MFRPYLFSGDARTIVENPYVFYTALLNEMNHSQTGIYDILKIN